MSPLEEVEEDGQTPNYVRRYYPECRCPDRARGRCWCEDDGDVLKRVEFEAYEHESSGYPRRA